MPSGLTCLPPIPEALLPVRAPLPPCPCLLVLDPSLPLLHTKDYAQILPHIGTHTTTSSIAREHTRLQPWKGG
jgi:hypothetical protein